MSIDALVNSIQSMMSAEGVGEDHLAQLNTMLEASEAIRSQLGGHQQAIDEMAQSHQQQLDDLRSQAEEAGRQFDAALTERDGRISELSTTIDGATQAYKAVALKANPEIPEELISGQSIAEIDASIETAKAIVEKIRAKDADNAADQIPAGAPPRGNVNTSTLSPADKIRAGLASR